MLLAPACAVCGRSAAAVCSGCAAELRPAAPGPSPLGIDAWWAVLGYDDLARALLVRLKNGQRRDLVSWLADRAVHLPVPAGAVVTWAPTSPGRRQRRGFDQAELLARALARRWRLPCRALLGRLPGPAQEGRRGLDRRAPAGFRSRGRSPASVVVVDDVATTGATLTVAARALRAAGATEVRAVVMARAAPGAGH